MPWQNWSCPLEGLFDSAGPAMGFLLLPFERFLEIRGVSMYGSSGSKDCELRSYMYLRLVRLVASNSHANTLIDGVRTACHLF
jgi:hypothetical protein